MSFLPASPLQESASLTIHPARALWISILCESCGHRLRFVCMKQGIGLTAATLIGCFAIGVFLILQSNVYGSRFGCGFRRSCYDDARTFAVRKVCFRALFELGVVGREGDAALVTATFAPLFRAISLSAPWPWVYLLAHDFGLRSDHGLTAEEDRFGTTWLMKCKRYDNE